MSRITNQNDFFNRLDEILFCGTAALMPFMDNNEDAARGMILKSALPPEKIEEGVPGIGETPYEGIEQLRDSMADIQASIDESGGNNRITRQITKSFDSAFQYLNARLHDLSRSEELELTQKQEDAAQKLSALGKNVPPDLLRQFEQAEKWLQAGFKIAKSDKFITGLQAQKQLSQEK